VLGNHDKYPPHLYLEHFLSIHGCMFWNDCILTHVPVHPSMLEHRSKMNVHGHLHSKHILTTAAQIDKRYFNVSCEVINLTPINADIILDTLKGLNYGIT
jgi:calcineurin-like phosphoesterase family protein